MEENNNAQSFFELQPGTGLCGGKYVIEKKIGEGGFGITYRAVQTGLNRAVCIKEYFLAGRCVRDVQAKTIHLQGSGEDLFEKYRKSFVREAQTLAALHHPGIVEVIDIFDENNTSYMVMPFVEGRSLQSIVEKQGPLSYPEAVNYVAQVASAVGYIHERHILHRDIKPDNIMITADYKAVLIDFGSAREFEEDKTQAQTSMVTHGYAPTEQYTRNSRKGAYTDIYAIGATLYFVLTAHVPLEAAARITETMPEPRELVPDLPLEANRTIMKAMQIKPQDRHQSIEEFMADLRGSGTAPESQGEVPAAAPAAVEAQPTTVSPASAPVTPTPKKKKFPVAVVIIAAVVLIGGAVGAYLFLGKEDPMAKEAAAAVQGYEQSYQRCEALIKEGSDPERLLEARKLLDEEVVPLESRYAASMPKVYNKADGLRQALEPKLKDAARQWAEMAFTFIEVDDYEGACECYERSLELYNDPVVVDEYKSSKEMVAPSENQ